MKKKTPLDAVLGLFVTQSRIEAVLLRQAGDHAEMVRRLTRQRLRSSEAVDSGNLATALPGLKGSDEADFTIQIGNGSGNSGQDMFLASEFAGLGAKGEEKKGAAPTGRPMLFVGELQEILAECKQLGYSNPRIAFCVGWPHVLYREVIVSRERETAQPEKKWGFGGSSSKEEIAGVDRRLLVQLLKAQHKGAFDAERVVFLPMAPRKEQRRFLALVPQSSEPVTPTLEKTFEQQRALVPSSRLLGTEVSLYTALVRKTLAPAENENTAVVRINSEDTIILFLSGKQLRHFERLPSLTSYDPPETICSRVLLQQDEQKIGDVHHVLVLTEGRTDQFLKAFRDFYPNAAVEPLQEVLFKRGLPKNEAEEDGLRPGSVAAVGMGLKLLEGWDEDPIEGVNLLPKRLRKRPRKKLAFAWHTAAMLLVLFGVSFFFVYRYLQQEAEIDRARQELRMNPPDPAMGTPAALQARVDSLRRVHTQYTRALHVLDSLLVGSDQWSRTLEMTARATNELKGVWFDRWQPTGTSIRIEGHATARSRVAQFAKRLDGSIEQTAFADVGEVRVYPFTVVVPRPIGMPRVAEYLKQALDESVDAPVDVGIVRKASDTSSDVRTVSSER